MNKLYCFRLYTEDINYDELLALTNDTFDAYTVYLGKGIWKGTPEHSLIIEVIGPVENRDKITQLAKDIKRLNTQDAVLITGHELTDYELV